MLNPKDGEGRSIQAEIEHELWATASVSPSLSLNSHVWTMMHEGRALRIDDSTNTSSRELC